jgi:hypothetical protein
MTILKVSEPKPGRKIDVCWRLELMGQRVSYLLGSVETVKGELAGSG